MTEYSAVAPPQQNFNQSTAFAAALQRAKQIAAKINPSGGSTPENRPKRPLEDGLGEFNEPDAKKLAGSVPPPSSQNQAPQSNRGPQGGPGMGAPGMGGPPGMGGMGGPGMGGPPSMGGPQINEDIKVPDKMVGLIIGRGGEQITRLQSESGCKIQMAQDSQGTPERVCSLSGTREAINRAKELIMNIVHQRGRSEGLGGLDLGPGLGQGNYQGMNNSGQMGGRNFLEIMIPGPKVGLIIGKGGETIKQLQERSGAKMVVIQDGPNQEQEKPLRISGDPAKVEYAKQLVYDLIAEKEMQAYNRRGGGRDDRQQYNDYGGGGNNEVEVLVPRAAVGVVIGKGGDMIKKIQAETGARVQFQQAREEGPGERRCYLSGKPQQVEQARQRIEELIDSVHRRDTDGGRGGGPMGRGGRDRYDSRGSSRNGNNQDYGGWDDRRPQQPPQEVTFTVPSSKCGVIIGRGGETIKQINQQSGAHCELDRRNQNPQGAGDKTFIIRGDPDQIETAKRIISDKVQMPLNFVTVGGSGVGNNLPTAYPGMAPQGFNPQNWNMPAYQQQWGTPSQGTDSSQQASGGVQMNPSTGQPDYSLQWAEYYRSLGMLREAELIEQQSKNKGVASTIQTSTAPGGPVPNATGAVASAAGATNGAQPDYSAQWAEYYRSIGKVKEAEAIEAQMKMKNQASGGQTTATAGASTMSTAPQGSAGTYQQQPYGAYQAPSGYYGGQAPQTGAPPVPQGQYGFPGYGYSGQTSGGQEN